MDLADAQTMLKDAIAFAREVQSSLKRGTLEGTVEAWAVLEHKIKSTRSAIGNYKAGKDETLRLAKLKSDFSTFERECQDLLHSLSVRSTVVPEPPQHEELLPVQVYSYEQYNADRVQSLASDLTALKSLYADTAELIGVQGEQLCKVEEHTDKAKEETAEAGKELKEAARLQNKRWKWYFGSGMGTVGGILGLIAGPVGVPIGAAIGGMAGAAVGKAFEDHENKALEEVKFEKD